MRILLDTCTFLWYVSADAALPQELASEVSSPENDVYLSVVSVWELSLKLQIGRLPTPFRAFDAVRQRKEHDITSLPLDEADVAHLARLPPVHRDPFDRMLVCQAIERGLTLLTPDAAIRSYPVKCLWA